jgi:hypothetical protein
MLWALAMSVLSVFLLGGAVFGGVAVGRRVRRWDAAAVRNGETPTALALCRNATVLTIVGVVWLAFDRGDWVALLVAVGLFDAMQAALVVRAVRRRKPGE